MQSINILPFGQLKNAEHVAFFNNVVIAIDKIGAEEIGLTVAKFTSCASALGVINEIVKDARTRLNQRLGRSNGSDSELDSNVSPIPFPNK